MSGGSGGEQKVQSVTPLCLRECALLWILVNALAQSDLAHRSPPAGKVNQSPA